MSASNADAAAQKLVLPQPVREAMIAHCLQDPSKEACGLLVAAGADGAVTRVRPMENVDHSPIHYTMDPREQLRVEKDLRQRGERVVGIYHSHTATAAYPSPVDVSLAISPELSYVLVSLQDQTRPDVKSYRIDGERILEEPIVEPA